MWFVWSVMLRMVEGGFENRLDHQSIDRIASIKSLQKKPAPKITLARQVPLAECHSTA